MQHCIVIALGTHHRAQPLEIGLDAPAQGGGAGRLLVFERHQLRGIVQLVLQRVGRPDDLRLIVNLGPRRRDGG